MLILFNWVRKVCDIEMLSSGNMSDDEIPSSPPKLVRQRAMRPNRLRNPPRRLLDELFEDPEVKELWLEDLNEDDLTIENLESTSDEEWKQQILADEEEEAVSPTTISDEDFVIDDVLSDGEFVIDDY